VDRLASESSAWLAEIVNAAFGAGLRITALLALQWNNDDFAKGVIHVRTTDSKSGKADDAPMLDRASTTPLPSRG
jgi:hypothetical protein